MSKPARVPAVVEFAPGIRRAGTGATRMSPKLRVSRPPVVPLRASGAWRAPTPVTVAMPAVETRPAPAPAPVAPRSWLLESVRRIAEMTIAALLACAILTWLQRPPRRAAPAPAAQADPVRRPLVIPLPDPEAAQASAPPARPAITIRASAHPRPHRAHR